MYLCMYIKCYVHDSSLPLTYMFCAYIILSSSYLKQCKYENTILFFCSFIYRFQKRYENSQNEISLILFFFFLLFLDLKNHGKCIMSFNRIKALQHRIPKNREKKIKRNKCNNYLYNFHKKFDIGRYLLYFYKTKKIRKIQKKTAIQPVLMSFLNVISKSQI